jgi:predicted secreted protein with PEFG-CTERM motif
VGALSISQAYGIGELACPDCGDEDSRALAMKAALKGVPVTVWTDSSTYDHESTIMVSGHVANVKTGVPVTLMVTSPTNNIVTIQQLNVNSDGSFDTTLNTAGSLWKYDGTYVIRAQYGNQETNNKVLVELTGGITAKPTTPTTPSVTCRSSELAVGGTCVPYTISGATVTGADVNTGDNSMIVRIDSMDDGILTLNPATETIRGVFMVLVDGQEWDDVSIDGQKVTVEFPAGTEEIEVIGTFVVPEFGTIAALILVVAIISIVAVSTRSRLSIMPKF